MSTILYISTTGNDSNDGVWEDPSSALRTAQEAFNRAYFGTGEYILNFGAGTFSGINLNDPNLIQQYIANNLGTTVSFYYNIDIYGIGSLSSGYIYATNGNSGGALMGNYLGGWIITSDTGDPYNNISAECGPGFPWNPQTGSPIVSFYTSNASPGWPSRIKLSGAGYNQTFLGGISANGNDSWLAPSGDILYTGNGQTLSITSDSTINLGQIWSNGGYDYACSNNNPIGGSGGVVSLTGCYFQQIHCDGNSSNCSSSSSDGSAGGGAVTLLNCHCTDTYGVSPVVSCNGSSPGGVAGTITATNCQLYSLQCSTDSSCSDAGNAQPGGTITLNSSSATYIDANGGSSYSGSGGNGGTVILNNSTVSNNINANGGDHCGYSTTGGSPGSVILQNGSTVSGSINTGYGQPQDYGCGLGNGIYGLIPDVSKVVSGVTYTAGAITYTGKLATPTTDNSQKNKLFLSAALGVPIP